MTNEIENQTEGFVHSDMSMKCPSVTWVTDKGFRVAQHVVKLGQNHRTPTFRRGDGQFMAVEASYVLGHLHGRELKMNEL